MNKGNAYTAAEFLIALATHSFKFTSPMLTTLQSVINPSFLFKEKLIKIVHKPKSLIVSDLMSLELETGKMGKCKNLSDLEKEQIVMARHLVTASPKLQVLCSVSSCSGQYLY